jgi:hypothetical protein
MFGPMNEALRGSSYGHGAKLVKARPKYFFSDGNKKKLVKRWNRCVEVESDYFSK